MKKVIEIEGMACNHCVMAVTNALEAVNGVKSVKVVLKKNNATVKLNEDVSNDILTKAIENAGFKVNAISE